MAAIHKTEGIILSHYDMGEADKFINLFTKDFGKISLVAKSVRTAQSKLKGHINTGSEARLMFTGNSEYMRLTDIEERLNFFAGAPDLAARHAMSSALRLVDRMVQGSERDDGIWDLLRGFMDFARKGGVFSSAATAEKVFGVRLLAHLGYIDGALRSELKEVVDTGGWSDVFVSAVGVFQISKLFDDGIYASGL
ncbi:MAG: DNA repair protein RecO [Candidatus Niyogibacteria bacterium]|nr:DNA repair protein RecO [Candidatus Niyogibacteria bacterium]